VFRSDSSTAVRHGVRRWTASVNDSSTPIAPSVNPKSSLSSLAARSPNTTPGKLQTVIEDMDLPNPVVRSHYKNGFAKQYVRDHANLRTEPATNNVTDYSIGKAIENPELRQKQAAIIDRYLDVQQDILETFIDRGQLLKLTQPTIPPNDKRIPGLRLHQPRSASGFAARAYGLRP